MKTKYTLGENTINGIEINTDIFTEAMSEFYIKNREDLIDDIIMYASEAMCDMSRQNDYQMMKEDIALLSSWNDDYILSSLLTNEYLHPGSDSYEEACEEILDLNKKNPKRITYKEQIKKLLDAIKENLLDKDDEGNFYFQHYIDELSNSNYQPDTPLEVVEDADTDNLIFDNLVFDIAYTKGRMEALEEIIDLFNK